MLIDTTDGHTFGLFEITETVKTRYIARIVANLDAVIDLETPKLRPHIDALRTNLADALGIDIARVSVKAKTGEAVDSVGELRAVTAQAIVLVIRESN